MKELINKASFIKNNSIAMIVLVSFFWIMTIILLISLSSSLSFYSDASYKAYLSFLILSGISSFVYFIFCLINAIYILATDWKNEVLNNGDCKILWGVFTLILLGAIASLVFGVKAENEYKKHNNITKEENIKVVTEN